MDRKKRIIISITGIVVILLCLLGLTYGYFLTQIKGNTNKNSIYVTSANLLLEYNDGNGNITATNLMPGDTIPVKTFTVTNNGNSKIEDYVVMLEEVTNNFYLRDDLTYTITCKSVNKNTDVVNGTCKGVTGVSFPRSDEVVIINDINAGITHKYEMTITYAETFENQSIDMNKTMSAKINIYDRTQKLPTVLDDTSMISYISTLDTMESYVSSYQSLSVNNDSLSHIMTLEDVNAHSNDYQLLSTNSNKLVVFNSISKLSYDSSSWTIVAGEKNTKYLNYLTQQGFDINAFKTMKYKATEDGEYSGVVHFSAALAALLHNTDAIYNLVMDEVEYNNLAGWAGDLQTLIANNLLSQISNVNDYDEAYNIMINLLGKSGTYFDSEDLYADVDAINIYKISTSSNSIKQLFTSYFQENYKKRFYSFIYNILREETSYTYVSDEQTYADFKAKVYHYTQYSSSWPLYDSVNSSKLTTTVAQAARDAFVDYIWYLSKFKKLEIFSHEIKFNKGTTVDFIAEFIDTNNKKDELLTNDDYTWTVTNIDGSACSSTINNGVLTIASNETNSQLLIKAVLNKSNKIASTRIIDLS